MNKITNFEMANGDDPKEIIKAGQRAFVAMLKKIVSDIKAESHGVPGLTWDQIEYLIDESGKKEPVVFTQELEN